MVVLLWVVCGLQIVLGAVGLRAQWLGNEAVSEPRSDTVVGRSRLFFSRLAFICLASSAGCTALVGSWVASLPDAAPWLVRPMSLVFSAVLVTIQALGYFVLRAARKKNRT